MADGDRSPDGENEYSQPDGQQTGQPTVKQIGHPTTESLTGDLGPLIIRPTVSQIETDPDFVGFVWAGRIPRGKVTILAGAGAAGKSSLMTGIAIARAVGALTFLGQRITAGATLFITAEDDFSDYLRKIAAWRSVYPTIPVQPIADRFYVLPLIGEAYTLVRASYGMTVVDAPRVDAIIRAIVWLRPMPDLIVIETASRFGIGEDNVSSAMLISACERLAISTGSAVVLVVHKGKEASREGAIDAYAARGGSAITDNARSVLQLAGIHPKQARGLLGRPLREDEHGRLMVLAAAKVNHAPRSSVRPLILEPAHEARHGLVLRTWPGAVADGAGVTDGSPTADGEGPELRVIEGGARGANGRRLAEVVSEILAAGERPNPRRLVRDRVNDLGIPQREIGQAIADAIADGWLVSEPAVGKGGGTHLKPGPRFGNDDPSSDGSDI